MKAGPTNMKMIMVVVFQTCILIASKDIFTHLNLRKVWQVLFRIIFFSIT